MAITKMRKQGNATMITIPRKLNPKVGQDYYIHRGNNGSFILVPKAPDIYANAKPGQYRDAHRIDPINYHPRGHEVK